MTELVAATEHVMGLNKVAMELLIEADASHLVVAPASDSEPPVGVSPELWRVLSLTPHYLEATWRKDRVVLSDGALDAMTKLVVALGVSMTNGCRYFIEYYATTLRQRGLGDGAILEIMGVVDHLNCLNKLADGMQIESDIRPPDLPGRSAS